MESFSCQEYRQKVLGKFFLNIDIQRSSGSYHYDSSGRKILDGVSQYGACPFGHNPNDLVDVLVNYYKSESPNFVQPFVPRSTQKLATRLRKLAGENYRSVIFSNSGTEAVEAALKLSRIKTDRKKVLSAINSYHGKTFASLSATGSVRYSAEGVVDNDNYVKVEFNDISLLEAELQSREYAALILEPVQGEGGMIPAEKKYLNEARELCSKYGTLFILDEIQTGLGRSGELLASNIYGLEADIILLSKALGGGLIPIGAVIVSNKAYSIEFDKKHSSTFANGGAASAVANAVLDKLEADNGFLIKHAQYCGEYITSKLKDISDTYPDLFAFSGKGMMYALHFKDTVTEGNYLINYAHKSDFLSLLICGYLFHRKGIFCMPLLGESNSASVRFQPALNITFRELNIFFKGFESVCALVSEQRYDVLMSYLITDPMQEREKKPNNRKKKLNRKLSPGKVAAPSASFAFLMHSTSENDVVRSLPQKVKENYTELAQQELAAWFFSFGEIDYEPRVVFEFSMESKTGVVVNGTIIYSPIGPQSIMRLSRSEKQKLIDGYIELAKECGANIIGLGAYTAVVTQGGLTLNGSVPMAITTGNSLTAMSTCKSIEDLFEGRSAESSLMIIGGKGSVGRIALIHLSNFFGCINIVGSPYSTELDQYKNLRNVIFELQESDIPIRGESAAGKFLSVAKELNKSDFLTTEDDTILVGEIDAIFLQLKNRKMKSFVLLKELGESNYEIDCVFSATSEGKAFINSGGFKKGCHIFDVARPFDFINTNNSENLHEGGLVSLPDKKARLSDSNIIGCRSGVNLACLSETIALAMEGVDQNYSVGREISISQAREVFSIAQDHGFNYFLEAASNRSSKRSEKEAPRETKILAG